MPGVPPPSGVSPRPRRGRDAGRGRYKALWRADYGGDASISETAQHIATQFLRESAPDLVSLPPRLVDPAVAAVDAARYSSTLFDGVQHHVADELSKRNLAKFVRDERRRDREPSLLPASTPDHANPAYEMKLVLDDAARGAAFRRWLDGEFAGESAAFYDAVAAYRALFAGDADLDEAAILAYARGVAAEFLADAAPTPVNVAAGPRARVLAALRADPVAPDVSLFDDLRVGVLKLLARDKLPRFRVAERTFDAPPSPTKARRGSFFATTKRPSLASLRPNLAGFRKRRGTVGAV